MGNLPKALFFFFLPPVHFGLFLLIKSEVESLRKKVGFTKSKRKMGPSKVIFHFHGYGRNSDLHFWAFMLDSSGCCWVSVLQDPISSMRQDARHKTTPNHLKRRHAMGRCWPPKNSDCWILSFAQCVSTNTFGQRLWQKIMLFLNSF